MKKLTFHSSMSSISFRAAFAIAVCYSLLFAFEEVSFAQWKQATGFSNVNASLPDNVDQVAGFTLWGDSLLASAFCADDLLNNPGATPDSLFLSTDHGQTWTDFAPYGQRPLVVVGNDFIGEAQPSPADNNISDAVLSFSTDYGQTWAIDTTGWNLTGTNGQALSLAKIGNTAYASNSYGVFSQTTPGGIWTLDSSGMGYTFPFFSEIGWLAASGNNLFLSTLEGSGDGIFVSTNQGMLWTSENSGLPSFTSSGFNNWYEADQFAVYGSSVYAVIAHDTDQFGGSDFDTVDIYLTTNNGQNWSKQNSSILNWGLLYSLAAYNQNLFAVTDSGFYYSSNNGSTWTQEDQGLAFTPGDYPNSVIVSGGNIVIGTNSSGAWYRSLSSFGISSVSANPTRADGLSLSLSQNPASSSEVKVTYTLPDASDAQILVMDELGRSVRMFQNGTSLPGENMVTLDSRTLDPGTYFVRLTADGAATMQKLVIAR